MTYSHRVNLPDRRDLMRGGAGLTLTALVSRLFAGATPAQAASLQGGASEIDRLDLRIVTDSYQMATAPDLTVGNGA